MQVDVDSYLPRRNQPKIVMDIFCPSIIVQGAVDSRLSKSTLPKWTWGSNEIPGPDISEQGEVVSCLLFAL